MTVRSMLMRSAAVGIIVLSAGSALAQGAPAQNATTGQPAPAVFVPVSVQQFIDNPNVLLSQFPQGGPQLQARIQALVAEAVQSGQVDALMAAIRNSIVAGSLAPSQIVALSGGANAAAAALASAGNQAAAASIQAALANPQVVAAVQSANERVFASVPQQPGVPQTAALGGGGAVGGGAPIGGAGAGAGTGASSTGTTAGNNGGSSSGGGTFSGSGGGGGSSNRTTTNNIDTSPSTRG